MIKVNKVPCSFCQLNLFCHVYFLRIWFVSKLNKICSKLIQFLPNKSYKFVNFVVNNSFQMFFALTLNEMETKQTKNTSNILVDFRKYLLLMNIRGYLHAYFFPFNLSTCPSNFIISPKLYHRYPLVSYPIHRNLFHPHYHCLSCNQP